ncbi:3-hexulose-6-phosphate synthase [Halobacillus litoralis]|uniref:3-hexulose-6-phosphate synthase n=1 Tax=Halobacillus litoralis TaxID=45668 RepID=UPI001CFCFEBA|nr:3-hexulose-6-phosphate synthase [Halobacillus litoralis]
MNLQLALDRMTKEECFRMLAETEESIDWIEVGTGVIKEYGMAIVREIKQAYPEKIIVADMKTCDAGKHEAAQAFRSGADITTVMAFSADQTIRDTLKVADESGGRVMIDLLGITDSKRIEELSQLGVDLVSLHFGKDMQESGEMKEEDLFSLIKEHSGLEVAVAGGINSGSLPRVLREGPDTIIVGSAITKQKDSSQSAQSMKGVMNEYENNRRYSQQ